MIVSVIIPTYNRELTLARAIDSVLKQDYKNYEILVVDDGSTDKTKEIVNKYPIKNIKYIRHENNLGGNYARNTGIINSKGKYIAFLDSDDEWHSEFLKVTIETIENLPSEYGVVYTDGYIKVGANIVKINSKDHIGRYTSTLEAFLDSCWLGTQRTLFRRECFEKVGYFDTNLKARQDWELFIRICQHFQFKYISKPLVTIYSTPNSVSKNLLGQVDAAIYTIQKHSNIFKKYPYALAKQHKIIGLRLLSIGYIEESRQYLYKSIRNTFNLKLLLILILTLLGKKIFYLVFTQNSTTTK